MKTFNAHLGIRKEIRELTFSPIREIVRFAENQDEVVPFWFGEPDVPGPVPTEGKLFDIYTSKP